MSDLYLIDGMSMVFRAYHAMAASGLKNSEGQATGAIYSFTNIITRLLETSNPRLIAVVFDTKEPTFRHDMYPEYKANRAAFPEDLGPQLIAIKELINLLGIKQIEMPGFEADDIIGTLSKKASDSKIETYCLTADKDFYQLVTDHVSILKPSRRDEDIEIISYEGVKAKFGVRPDQVIEVQALMGDPVDNVPGVKGVGEKTAIPLIQKYGNIENLYEHLDEITSKSVKAKLIDQKENAFLSKILVTIKPDVPIDITPEELTPNPVDYKGLDEFFKNQGIRGLREKWHKKYVASLGENNLDQMLTESEFNIPSSTSSKIQTINDVEHNYQLVNTIENLDAMIEDIKDSKKLSFDLETSSLDRDRCEIVGVALSDKEKTGYYIATFYEGERTDKKNPDSLFSTSKEDQQIIKNNSLPIDIVIDKIKPILENPNIEKVGQNAKFDAYILLRHDIRVSPITFDSMIASYIIDSDSRHGMDTLAEQWLNYKAVSITELIGEKKSTQISMRDVDVAKVSDYACEDADITLQLCNLLEKELEKVELTNLATKVEFPLIEILTEMEANGICIDKNMLSLASEKMTEELKNLTEKIHLEAGIDFNIDSTKQLAHILFEKLMLPAVKKTKTGYSTDSEVLSELAPMYPIAEYLLDYRQISKLRSTYVDALPKLVNPETGRIHTTYNMTIASTGRLSSTDPNLQNIPIRSEMGKQIRKAFVACDEDHRLISADYSQIELRIMAAMCNDEHLISAFVDGLDIHTATASVLYNIPINEVNSDTRRIAKTVNFGIMYGLGSFGLSQRLKISRNEAKEIIDNYFEKYPGIKTYMDTTIEQTRKKGFATTMMGRKRFFPNINSNNRNLRQADERAAINMPIQGTASDMMKLAMINVHRMLHNRNFKTKMLLQVHDELVFESPLNEIEEVSKLIKSEMENALLLDKVPVLVETGTASNWFDAH